MTQYGDLRVEGSLVVIGDLSAGTGTFSTLTVENITATEPVSIVLAGTEGSGVVYSTAGEYTTLALSNQFTVVGNTVFISQDFTKDLTLTTPVFNGTVTISSLAGGSSILTSNNSGEVSGITLSGNSGDYLTGSGVFAPIPNAPIPSGVLLVYEHIFTHAEAGIIYPGTHNLIPVDAVLYSKYQDVYIKRPAAIVYISSENEVVWQSNEYIFEGKIVVFGRQA